MSRDFHEPCQCCSAPLSGFRELPLCEPCRRTHADPDMLRMWRLLLVKSSPLAVMTPFTQALVADCQENLKRHQFAALG